MPIETAPKDKIEILAWSKRHGVNVGILTHYKRPEMPSRKGGWFLPTHWMPLPSPPNDQEVRAENGIAEKRLRAVCQSEQRSRTSAISEYGDPREWDEPEKCIVCGDDEPCAHDFDKISWPNVQNPSTP
jgi:hypothetical protein